MPFTFDAECRFIVSHTVSLLFLFFCPLATVGPRRLWPPAEASALLLTDPAGASPLHGSMPVRLAVVWVQ